jgi:hypothetical protein
MSLRKCKILIPLIISVFFVQSEAQTKLSAQSIMKFLNISVGARAAGMGDSFITNGDDISVAFWNPAGIGQLNGFNTMVEMNRWISDVSQYSFAASTDIGDYGVVGVTFTMMDYGEIHGTTIDLVSAGSGAFEYIETGDVSVSNFALGLVYARAISNQFSIGGQVRYVYSGLGSNLIQSTGSPENLDNNLSALAFDLGTRFNTEFKDLTFSMSLRNFSREVRYPKMTQGYYLPLLFTLGFSIDAAALIIPGSEMHSLVVSVNGLHPMDYSEKMNAGFEYGFQKQFFLRGGYKFNYSIESYSMGIGMRYPISNEEYLQFDYSYSAIEYFTGVHRISVSSHF